jgi:hypothetical protein
MGWFGGKKKQSNATRRRASRARRVRAFYDAAQTTADNRRWWANADALSARGANSPGKRKTLRERSRYEAANNCYAGGIVKTLAEDTIGTGPRIQLTGLDSEDAALVEREFREWCKAIGLADYLQTMRRARSVDGESFAILKDNPQLPTRVQLDLRLVESELVCEPQSRLRRPGDMSGCDCIDYDSADNA